MLRWTPLGSHPDAKDQTPKRVKLISSLVIVSTAFLALFLYLTTDKGLKAGSGLFNIVLGISTFIDVWYNRENYQSVGSKLFLLIPLFFIFIGIVFIFEA